MRLNFHDLVNSIKVMSIVVSLYFNNSYTVISHNLQGTSYFKFIKHVIRPIFSVFYSFNIFFCLFLNPAPIKWSFGQVNCYKFWFILFFKFFIIIIFFLLYTIVLVLPYINMHPPRVSDFFYRYSDFYKSKFFKIALKIIVQLLCCWAEGP